MGTAQYAWQVGGNQSAVSVAVGSGGVGVAVGTDDTAVAVAVGQGGVGVGIAKDNGTAVSVGAGGDGVAVGVGNGGQQKQLARKVEPTLSDAPPQVLKASSPGANRPASQISKSGKSAYWNFGQR
jgi:hypothetical protein